MIQFKCDACNRVLTDEESGRSAEVRQKANPSLTPDHALCEVHLVFGEEWWSVALPEAMASFQTQFEGFIKNRMSKFFKERLRAAADESRDTAAAH